MVPLIFGYFPGLFPGPLRILQFCPCGATIRFITPLAAVIRRREAMKYKLLIAEDEPLERAALCETLNRHLGEYLTIYEAGNGTEALNLFHLKNPEIAILNIEMPGLSGLDVAEKIRESNKLCAILFITDHGDFSCARQAISLRALDYILKPYDEQKLIASIEEAIAYCTHFRDFSSTQPLLHHSDDIQKPDDLPEGTRLALVREDISAYIEAHYMEELSMKNVARAMNYSDAYFCKLFKQCFHVNFSAYLNEYRIEKAKSMMKNPRTSVKDISTACGYTDSNYFARVFKKVTDLTPSEYRLSILEKSLKI